MFKKSYDFLTRAQQ